MVSSIDLFVLFACSLSAIVLVTGDCDHQDTHSSTANSHVPHCGGDTAPWCGSSPSRDCYSSSDTCCATCRQHKRQLPGCEYGDRVSWCSKHIHSSKDCFRGDLGHLCCLTCNVMLSADDGSLLGKIPWQGCYGDDKADWCRTVRADQCYVSDDVCCDACRRLFNGTPGCEYGNKADWCEGRVTRSEDCENKETANLCCVTCRQFK